jgi:hypothetical protein
MAAVEENGQEQGTAIGAGHTTIAVPLTSVTSA